MVLMLQQGILVVTRPLSLAKTLFPTATLAPKWHLKFPIQQMRFEKISLSIYNCPYVMVEGTAIRESDVDFDAWPESCFILSVSSQKSVQVH